MPVDYKLPLLRRPLPATLDLTSPMSLRLWMTQLVAGEFASTGQIVPRLRWVCATHVEETPLTDLPDPSWSAALWAQLSDRPEVLGSFRIGPLELAVPREDGTPATGLSRCACVLERIAGPGEPWWLGVWELPKVLDRSTPVSWLAQDGDGYDLLPGVLRAWVDPGGRTVGVDARPSPNLGGVNRPALDDEEPRLMVHFAELAVPAPRDLAALARLADRMLRERELLELATQRPPVVLVLRGATIERWQPTGGMPCGLDDLARNVCGLGDPPDGVIVIDRAPTIAGHEALRVSAERAGERLSRTMVPGDPPEWLDPVRAELGDHGWIGVDPVIDLGLVPESYPGVTPAGGDFH